MEYALEINALRKEYPGFTLRDVSFALPRGHIMGLIGPNGAGKTTVIKLILNIVRRDGRRSQGLRARQPRPRGGGQVPDRLRPRRDALLRLPQGRRRSPLSSRPFYATWDGARFDRLCREFELPRRKRVNALSRGMKMKLALAVALSHGGGTHPPGRADLGPRPGLPAGAPRAALGPHPGRPDVGPVLDPHHLRPRAGRRLHHLPAGRRARLLGHPRRDPRELGHRQGRTRTPRRGDRGGLFRSVSRGPYGFTALTADKEEARRRLAGRGVVIERVRLDDLVFFLGQEGRQETEAPHE